MTVLSRYDSLVSAGELRPDPEQRAAAERLSLLADAIDNPPKRGLLARLTGKDAAGPRGVYLWGGVGRGKSMLMDLFYDCVAEPAKRRVHFHAFMIEVHARLATERAKEVGNPVPPVAEALAKDLKLLAFDEMVINNTADAMVLSRLFTEMMTHGVTMVATSNRPPVDLYKDGLQRDSFLPFIQLLETNLDVLPLNGPTDYRRYRLGAVDTWLVPNGAAATEALSAAFFRLTDYPVEDAAHVPACDLDVGGGRTLHVPKALKGVGVFSFKRLCGEARGGAGLSGDCTGVPYRHPGRHSGAGSRQSQRGGPVRDADRRIVRISGEIARGGGCAAGRPLPEGRRAVRIRPDDQPAGGNAVGGLSGRGAWRGVAPASNPLPFASSAGSSLPRRGCLKRPSSRQTLLDKLEAARTKRGGRFTPAAHPPSWSGASPTPPPDRPATDGADSDRAFPSTRRATIRPRSPAGRASSGSGDRRARSG